MEMEQAVLNLLIEGITPTEAATKLGISRTTFYTILATLEQKGILSRIGDLPDGAIAEVCPPPELPNLFEHVFDWLGWTDRSKREIRNFCTRYGWLPPLADGRYSRSQWSGHAVRRVDFKDNGLDLMVVGFLVPRQDKQAWDRATPQNRLVCVESTGSNHSFPIVLRRGTVVDPGIVADVLSVVGSNGSPTLLTSMALALAWVCEGRAVLKPIEEGTG